MQSEVIPLVKAGTVVHAVWDKKEQDMTFPDDRLLVPLGDMLECEILKDKSAGQ